MSLALIAPGVMGYSNASVIARGSVDEFAILGHRLDLNPASPSVGEVDGSTVHSLS